jgi:hypothetical protein
VPLSEHEQRLLDQMERALAAEDPKFASALQGAELRALYRRRFAMAVVGVAIGAAGAATGAVLGSLPIMLAGIAVALISAWFTMVSWRRMPAPGELAPRNRLRQRLRHPHAAGAGQQAIPRGRFMQRMEIRWQRRRERDGF